MIRKTTFILVAGLAALAVDASAFTFLDRSYGTPQLGISARSRGMGGTGVALGNGSYSLIDNPAAMVLSRGTRVDFLAGLNRVSEDRLVSLYDTFDSFVDENAIAVNDHRYGTINAGFVLDEWGEKGVLLSGGYFTRYDPRYDYSDERRTTNTSDEIINQLFIETSGIVQMIALGAAYQFDKGIGVGLAVNYYWSDYKDRVALVPRNPNSAAGVSQVNRRLNGWSATLGGLVEVNERITVGGSFETKASLDNDFTVFENGEDVTGDPGNGKLEYPLRVQGGLTYRPRNSYKTTFAFDLLYTPWTDLVDDTPAAQDPTGADGVDLYPPTTLEDTWEARFGLEHIFYNNLPARIGFRYGESYALREANNVTFTFGVGYIVDNITIDIALEIYKRESRQTPVRPRDEQGPAVGLGRDKVDDSMITGTLGATYLFGN